MTIALKGTKSVTGWSSSAGQPVGFFLDGVFYDEDEAIKLRDYLIKNLPK